MLHFFNPAPRRRRPVRPHPVDRRLELWERFAELPLTFAALAFLAAYALPIIWPDMSLSNKQTCALICNVVWLGFVIDYCARIAIARDKRHFILTRWFDLLTVALPIFRPLRLLRLVFLIRVLNRRVGATLRGRITSYMVSSALLLVFVGALTIVDAERQVPDAQITEFGEGVWWSFVTITSVGYGDVVPVSFTGRVVAIVLMIFGIALLGTVTATLASWIVERVGVATVEAGEHSPAHSELMREIRDLRDEVRALRQEAAQRQTEQAPADEPPSAAGRPTPGSIAGRRIIV